MLNTLRRTGAKLLGMSMLMGLGLFALAPTARAAEDLTLKFGPFRRTVTVDSLKEYASTGKATGNLRSVLSVVKSDQRQSLNGLLQTRLPYGVVEVDRLMRSAIGSQILTQVAGATLLPANDPKVDEIEVLALRSAIIGAAAQDQNIQFLTLLEKYPTPNLTVDIAKLNKILANPALRPLLNR